MSVEVQFRLFLISALDVGKWPASNTRPLYPGEGDFSTNWMGGCMGPIPSLGVLKKTKFISSFLHSPDFDWVTPASVFAPETTLLLFFTFVQGIYNYIHDTNHVCRVYNVSYIICLQFIIHISLMSCFQVCCSAISWMTFRIIIIIIIIIMTRCEGSDVIMAKTAHFVQILTINCVWPRRAGF